MGLCGLLNDVIRVNILMALLSGKSGMFHGMQWQNSHLNYITSPRKEVPIQSKTMGGQGTVKFDQYSRNWARKSSRVG